MKKTFTSLAILLLAFSGLIAQGLEYRVWQFHVMKPVYVKKVMSYAGDYNINTVCFSHRMIGETSDLYSEDGFSQKGEELRQLAVHAKTNNLKTWIWVHELDNVPEKYLKGKTVQMDKKGFWTWLEKRYMNLFQDYPEFDGIILTFHETQYKVFSDSQVSSKLSKPKRFGKMVATINKACLKYNKDFVVRTFLYEPEQLDWVKDGLLKADAGNVIVQSKCVPHDWQPYYPHNPLIGAFPNNRQIVEFDCSSEFTGKNRIPFASAQYFQYRWTYGLRFSQVRGYIARLDHNGFDGFFTPNNINTYTLFRLSRDPELSADQIWKEWAENRYGKQAAPYVIKALDDSEMIIKKTLYHLEFWITNKSVLPKFSYADGHISSRTLAKWKPDEPRLKEMEDLLNHPNIEIYEKLLAEKDEAIAMILTSMIHLQEGKPYLNPDDYSDLRWRMDNMLRVAIIWKLHTEAFFGYKILKEGHLVPGLAERIERAIAGLILQAEVAESNPLIGDLPPGGASNIKMVAEELLDKLNAL
jgi:hypothetical protein